MVRSAAGGLCADVVALHEPNPARPDRSTLTASFTKGFHFRLARSVLPLCCRKKCTNVFVEMSCNLARGLHQIAENILAYLDSHSLAKAEVVCKEWQRVIAEGMLWRKLIERNVRIHPLWRGLSSRRGWIRSLFKHNHDSLFPHQYYRTLYPTITRDIRVNCCLNLSLNIHSFWFLFVEY